MTLTRRFTKLAVLAVWPLAIACVVNCGQTQALVANVTASNETSPVTHDRDAADDPAIWIHPTDVSLSTIIGTDKKGALEVYRVTDGERILSEPVATGNVDLRYNFPLSGTYLTGESHKSVTLACSFRKGTGNLGIWKINPFSNPPGALENVEVAAGVKAGSGGTGMYVSPVSGRFYDFQNGSGKVVQSELFASTDEPGKVNARIVRTVSFAEGTTEGVVADDDLGYVYVSDEANHIVYRLSAEPDGASELVVVGAANLKSDTEGLAIYRGRDGAGYLIVSNQGENNFAVFERRPPDDGGPNRFVGKFAVVDDQVDGVSSTDGIDVCSFPVGAPTDFSQGLFVAQDGKNPGGNQNFKLVAWERIAQTMNLTIDTQLDPRKGGYRLLSNWPR